MLSYNAECLVQVEMRHIRAVVTWSAQTDLSVQVRSVKVNLTTVFVNQLTQLAKIDRDNSFKS